MTKPSVFSVLFAFCVVLPGCADSPTESALSDAKVNRKYLLGQGFKQKFNDRELYELETNRLTDVLRDLGVSLADFEPAINARVGYDCRIAELKGWRVGVESQVDDPSGRSLEKPNTLCKVLVEINRAPGPTHLKTENSPRVRVTSVAVSRDGSRPLEIALELSADGKTPLALAQHQFGIRITVQGESPPKPLAVHGFLVKGTPDRILVFPGKPVTLTLNISGGFPQDSTSRPWSDFPTGKYVVRVLIDSGKDESERPSFDYQWVGRTSSDEYKVVIK
jgi:hypothetical protein